MDTHIPEPWLYAEHNWCGHDPCPHHHTVCEILAPSIEAPLAQGNAATVDAFNFRRIVACVNACKGIPTEDLEGFMVNCQTDAARLASLSLAAQHSMLEAQHKEKRDANP